MNKYLIFCIVLIFLVNKSYSQIMNDIKPEYPPKFGIKKTQKKTKELNSLTGDKLILNKEGLYCWQIKKAKLVVLNGETVIFSYNQSSEGDNPITSEYISSKGEFVKGKYHGIWKFYDKNGKHIKSEKWKNGLLIYKRVL